VKTTDLLVLYNLGKNISKTRHFQQYFSYIVAANFIDGGTGVPGENHQPVASY
jgi:hypothetical protein